MQHHSATPPNLIEHILALQAIGEAIAQERRAAFERAAETLGIDASVLRRRISRLAKWAGGPLIAGRGQRSQLTARGRDLLARGEDLLIAAQRLLTEDAGQPEMVLPLRVWIEDELDAHRAAAALVAWVNSSGVITTLPSSLASRPQTPAKQSACSSIATL